MRSLLEIPYRSVCLANRRTLDSVGQKLIQHNWEFLSNETGAAERQLLTGKQVGRPACVRFNNARRSHGEIMGSA
jgi:glutamate 5-kinase